MVGPELLLHVKWHDHSSLTETTRLHVRLMRSGETATRPCLQTTWRFIWAWPSRPCITPSGRSDLLIQAVASYAITRTAAVRATLGAGSTGTKLRAMLLEIASHNDGGRGCLLVNTAVELGPHDEGVRQLVKAGFEGMMGSFEEVIRSGQARGDIDSTVDAAKHAMTLVAGIAGLRVMAKSGFNRKQLVPFVETLLAGMSL